VTAYFLDSSAVAKLYVRETGTRWMTELIDRSDAHQFYVNRITPVEVAAVIFRRSRSERRAGREARDALDSLRSDVESVFQLVELDVECVDVALDVAEKFALRGYDCVQLAGSLLLQRYRDAVGHTPLIFVGSDRELNLAAEAEGLSVENPNDHG
jgi:predicted nucleic acid-binding protein